MSILAECHLGALQELLDMKHLMKEDRKKYLVEDGVTLNLITRAVSVSAMPLRAQVWLGRYKDVVGTLRRGDSRPQRTSLVWSGRLA